MIDFDWTNVPIGLKETYYSIMNNHQIVINIFDKQSPEEQLISELLGIGKSQALADIACINDLIEATIKLYQSK